jgi:predicted RNA-binding protein with PUA-like domain
MRLTVRGGHLFSFERSVRRVIRTGRLFRIASNRSTHRNDLMRHWLMKSEPSECSIDDLAKAAKQTVPWVGVRNFQARNFMRNDMEVGDDVLFYHSSCPEPGIVGLAKVSSAAYPDATQFDPQSHYHDPKSPPDKPRWYLVDVKLAHKTRLLSLAEMRESPTLASMRVLRRGNRLSITPVTDEEWEAVQAVLGAT